jgi:hypothetical protein
VSATVNRLLFSVTAATLLAACGDDGDPAPAAIIDVTIAPERQWYQTGQPVMLVGFVTDDSGDLVDGASVVWSVEPAGAATPITTTPADALTEDFLLATQGRVTLTGCVDAPGGACDAVSLQVDDGSPVVELTAPLPGGESDHAGGIEVAGSVSDAGLTHVFVGGRLVETDGLGQFQAVVPARFGVNHVAVVASDGVTPETGVELDVLWAPRFAPAIGDDGRPSIGFTDGVSLSLGQSLFDDGVALDPDRTPITSDDLADIVELVVAHADLSDLVPDPVVDQAGFTLRIPAIAPGPATASITTTRDGVELFLRLPALELTTAGSLRIDETTLDLGGTITASVAGSAAIHIGKTDGGELVVELADLGLALESATGTFASPETGAVFRLAQGLLRTTIEEQLVAAVEGTIASTVPALLRNVLGALDTALADRELVLSPDFTAPITLQLDGRLRTVTARAGAEVAATLRARVGTTSQAIHPTTRGVALATFPDEASDAAPPFQQGRPLQLAVHQGFLNGLLHALWSSGLLEIDLLGLVSGDLSGLLESGQISGKLPPVLRAPRPGEPGPFTLSIGQLELDLVLTDGSHGRFAVTLDVDVALSVEGSTIAVQAPGEPRIRIWTLLASESPILSEDLIAELLLDQWPGLRDSLFQSLRLELPLPSLGDLGDLAPELAELALSLEVLAPPVLQGGYLIIAGALRGAVPAPAP